MKKNEPKVTILIPTYNEEKHIIKLLGSLLNLDYKNYKIIVIVDKNTQDHTYEIAKNFSKQDKRIKVIQNNKNGSAANRNRGILEADKNTKYFAFTDGDCYVDRNWLRILVGTIENAPEEVKCVGGINLTPRSDSEMAKLTGSIEQTKLGGGNTAQTKIFKKQSYVDSIPNCNALYKKEVWEKNKQDEKLITGQDGEFNYRLRKKGARFIVTPKALVWHHRPATLKKYLKRMYNYGKASVKIAYKHKADKDFMKSRWYGFMAPSFFIALLLLTILGYVTSIPVFLQAFYFLSSIYLLAIVITSLKVIYLKTKFISLLTPLILILQHLSYSFGVVREIME